jgi:hypothetical protein
MTVETDPGEPSIQECGHVLNVYQAGLEGVE